MWGDKHQCCLDFLPWCSINDQAISIWTMACTTRKILKMENGGSGWGASIHYPIIDGSHVCAWWKSGPDVSRFRHVFLDLHWLHSGNSTSLWNIAILDIGKSSIHIYTWSIFQFANSGAVFPKSYRFHLPWGRFHPFSPWLSEEIVVSETVAFSQWPVPRTPSSTWRRSAGRGGRRSGPASGF